MDSLLVGERIGESLGVRTEAKRILAVNSDLMK
jgi:hypothetical protein